MAQRKLEFHEDSVSPSRTTFGRSASYSRLRTSHTLLRSWPDPDRHTDFEVVAAPPTTSTSSSVLPAAPINAAASKVSITHHDRKRTYSCDSVLAGAANTQAAVFAQIGTPVVLAATQGFNRCIIAYGATGTGKTRTVFGSEDEQGLVQFVLHSLLDPSSYSGQPVTTVDGDAVLAVVLSMVELHAGQKNDVSICDLFDKRAELVIRQRDQRFELEHADVRGKGPATRHITSLSCIDEVLKQGLARRKTAETPRNAKSSRGHVIVTAQVRARRNGVVYDSVTRFVDLAGNEPGGLTEETPFINSSLSALSHVLGSIGRVNEMPRFRDHPLTLLLKTCLEGAHCFSYLIATVDPRNATQTIATLDWVSATRRMVAVTQLLNRPALAANRAAADEASDSSASEREALIRSLQDENAKLKQLLDAKQTVLLPAVATPPCTTGDDDRSDDDLLPYQSPSVAESPNPQRDSTRCFESEAAQALPSNLNTPTRITEPTVVSYADVAVAVSPQERPSLGVQCEVAQRPARAVDTQTAPNVPRGCQTSMTSTSSQAQQTESTWRGRQTRDASVHASTTCDASCETTDLRVAPCHDVTTSTAGPALRTTTAVQTGSAVLYAEASTATAAAPRRNDAVCEAVETRPATATVSTATATNAASTVSATTETDPTIDAESITERIVTSSATTEMDPALDAESITEAIVTATVTTETNPTVEAEIVTEAIATSNVTTETGPTFDAASVTETIVASPQTKTPSIPQPSEPSELRHQVSETQSPGNGGTSTPTAETTRVASSTDDIRVVGRILFMLLAWCLVPITLDYSFDLSAAFTVVVPSPQHRIIDATRTDPHCTSAQRAEGLRNTTRFSQATCLARTPLALPVSLSQPPPPPERSVVSRLLSLFGERVCS